VAVVAAVTVLAALVVFLAYRPLLFSTFDPEVAQASGVPTARLEALTMVVLSTCILVSMQVIGVTLVAANLVIPPATARMLTHRFGRMLWLSTILGTATGTVGMIASYHLDVPSGATITLLGAALFVAVYGWTGARSVVTARS
jgi:ABC-type Mn2+/Zn2+ transport system permease subunit